MVRVMQIVRLVGMVLAVAGVIYALEYVEGGGVAVWTVVGLLGVGFVGLLVTFRMTQRRIAAERRQRDGESASVRRWKRR